MITAYNGDNDVDMLADLQSIICNIFVLQAWMITAYNGDNDADMLADLQSIILYVILYRDLYRKYSSCSYRPQYNVKEKLKNSTLSFNFKGKCYDFCTWGHFFFKKLICYNLQ